MSKTAALAWQEFLLITVTKQPAILMTSYITPLYSDKEYLNNASHGKAMYVNFAQDAASQC